MVYGRNLNFEFEWNENVDMKENEWQMEVAGSKFCIETIVNRMVDGKWTQTRTHSF
jgi:hypothetical protein